MKQFMLNFSEEASSQTRHRAYGKWSWSAWIVNDGNTTLVDKGDSLSLWEAMGEAEEAIIRHESTVGRKSSGKTVSVYNSEAMK